MTASAATAAAAGETVRLYCQAEACGAEFSLSAPSSPFDLTLCTLCRRGYLDDCPAPFPPPAPAPLRPPPPPQPSAKLLPPPPPRWMPSSSSSFFATPPPAAWPSSPSTSYATPLPLPLPLPPPPPPRRPSSSASSSSSTWRTAPMPCSSSSRTASPTSSASSSAASSPLRFLPPPPPPPWTLDEADFLDADDEPQPAPIPWITQLPVVTVSGTEVLCALCTNPIPRRARRLSCGHLFHFSCITPWLLTRYSCPVSGCYCGLHGLPPPPPSPPRPPPPPPPLTLSRRDPLDGSMDTWDYFGLVTEEGEPSHRAGRGTSAGTLPLPTPASVSDAPLVDFNVYRSGLHAAPAASIAALPTVTVSEEAEVCAVCTDDLPPAAAARRLPCGHLYHSDCIVPWLSQHNSCPVCRRSIPLLPSPGEETDTSSSQTTMTIGRRRSLPGARRTRRICNRLLRYMGISRARQPTTGGGGDVQA